MTADEFEKMSAERRHTTVAEQRAEGQVAVPCDCDYVGCEGWRLTSKYALALEVGLTRPAEADAVAAALHAGQDFEAAMREVAAIAAA